ncbi:V/A-type H+/Na+-transporting ATPase subunit I [Gammaproteobacteria bacterium]
MIEPLKKITLVTLDHDRDKTLEHLRDLAIIHLQISHGESPEQAAAASAMEQLQATILNVRELATTSVLVTPDLESVEQFAHRVETILAERQVCVAERDQINLQLAELAPWGDFDLDLIHRSHAAGLHIYLCAGTVPERLSVETVIQIIATNQTTIYFVVISPHPVSVELPEIHLPTKSISELRRVAADLAVQVAQFDIQLAQLGARNATLEAALHGRHERFDFFQARDSLSQDGRLLHLSGYILARREVELRVAADTHGWALRIEEPTDDDQDTPTFLTMPNWLKFAMPLFEFIGILPGYREFDITSWFTGFFIIFFAMIIGDAAYGVIFSTVALIGLSKVSVSQRPALKLILILSQAATIWGVLNGSWFGIEDRSILPSVMRGIPWFQEMRNIQWLCFLLGAIHLSIAHIWKGLVTMNSLTCLAQFGWTLVIWGNFFLASQLVADQPAPEAMFWLYGIGGGLVLCFTAPSRNLLKTIISGIITLINPSGGAISSFGDLLSYIRLFAVGLSGAYVANSFNMMGGMFEGGILGFLVGILIIVFGHTLNMALSSLSVLVHGIRLNTLEFSGHIGVEWGGQPFRAFARRRVSVEASQ